MMGGLTAVVFLVPDRNPQYSLFSVHKEKYFVSEKNAECLDLDSWSVWLMVVMKNVVELIIFVWMSD